MQCISKISAVKETIIGILFLNQSKNNKKNNLMKEDNSIIIFDKFSMKRFGVLLKLFLWNKAENMFNVRTRNVVRI